VHLNDRDLYLNGETLTCMPLVPTEYVVDSSYLASGCSQQQCMEDYPFVVDYCMQSPGYNQGWKYTTSGTKMKYRYENCTGTTSNAVTGLLTCPTNTDTRCGFPGNANTPATSNASYGTYKKYAYTAQNRLQ